MKIFILVKRNILTIIFGIFMVLLIVFSKNNLSAAKDGLVLWANCVVPALFPFFIATELLNYTNIASIFGRFLNKFMKPIFNIPGEGAYAFLMGIISGYPVGAKIVSDFYSKNICTKEEAERMLAFTNNSGPLFIIGTVGIALFGNSTIGILLFITHILSSISVGIILGIFSRLFHTYKLKSFNYRSIDDEADYSISSLGNILSNSIQKAISTIFLIGGFVVLFSIILSICNRLNIFDSINNILNIFNIPTTYSKSIICGLIELTNGVNTVSSIHTKIISYNIIISAFLLGFGGFSILLQVLSIIAKSKLSIKIYLYGKIMQGAISSLYTILFIKYVPIFMFDLPNDNFLLQSKLSIALALGLIFFSIILIFRYYDKKAKNI